MKAILEYTLPDDRYEYALANKAGALSSALWDIQQEIRKLHKYGHQHKTMEDLLEAIYSDVCERIGNLCDEE